MELYQLKAVLAVARTGQLARAAEQLHLTQSAISKQIKGLEDELGVLLFDRTPTGMTVTAAGRRLLPIAGRVVDATQEMTALASSLRGNVSGVLRLGTIIDPESIRLGPLLAALLQFYPHIDVTLAHGISGSVLQMLRDGQVDAGFYLGTLHDPEITVHPLAVEHYVVVAPAAWEAKLRGASLQELAADARRQLAARHGRADVCRTRPVAQHRGRGRSGGVDDRAGAVRCGPGDHARTPGRRHGAERPSRHLGGRPAAMPAVPAASSCQCGQSHGSGPAGDLADDLAARGGRRLNRPSPPRVCPERNPGSWPQSLVPSGVSCALSRS